MLSETVIRRILDADGKTLDPYFSLAEETSIKLYGKKIAFYAPSFTYYRVLGHLQNLRKFPTISITGSSCSLKCKHCDGKVLRTMIPATTPQKLIEVCRRLKAEGAEGCLISGGCLPGGSVPLERFAEAIALIKRETGLLITVHTGLIGPEAARKLKEACVDAALIDIIGDNETIREIYNLNATVNDFEDSLRVIKSAGLNLVPHVLAGLHYGKLRGEVEALKIISRYSPATLVIIAFMPIRGTPMGNVPPPTPLDIARVILIARLMFPKIPLALGCMRPKGEHRVKTDILAVKAGINAIAFPTEEAIKFAEKRGYEIKFYPTCCSQVYMNLTP